jgi:K+-sensing histidine kinase KdpD
MGRGYAFAVLAVAAFTGLVGLLIGSVPVPDASVLYLIAVLASGARYGSGPAVAAALLAFATSNFLFVEPRYTLHVADPGDLIALGVFLVTALITGQLAAALRRRAEEARANERKAAEAEILRRTDELRTSVMRAVSHDLRTPLASIIASAGSLRRGEAGWSEAERAELLGAIEEEAQRLNRIVGNLLDLSRIEAGALKPQKDWYDLGALVDDVVGRLRPVTAGHHVVLAVPDDLPPVQLDYVEIDQVLTNLLENAVKYAPGGSEVGITIRVVGQEVRVEVCDRGPGLPAGAVAELFEPFVRAGAGDRSAAGTGIGLAVARGLVEAHGGRIWAANRDGGGASFAFSLPLADVRQPVG